jgi:hypothetical protein
LAAYGGHLAAMRDGRAKLDMCISVKTVLQ